MEQKEIDLSSFRKTKIDSYKKDIVCKHIKNLTNDDLIILLYKTYEEGFVDGYNDNDDGNEFDKLLDNLYNNAIN